MNKKKIVGALALALIATSAITAGVNAAQIPGSNKTDFAAKIAQKFNLNQTDVQAFFDEHAATMKAERDAKMKEMGAQIEEKIKTELAKLVADGKLTQAQADLILAKRAELVAAHAAKTPSKERDEMKTKQDELKKWLTDNGIAEEYARFIGGGMGHGGFGGHGGPRGKAMGK